ncbi:MAG: hypothetical protein WC683_04430 [bacterium]
MTPGQKIERLNQIRSVGSAGLHADIYCHGTDWYCDMVLVGSSEKHEAPQTREDCEKKGWSQLLRLARAIVAIELAPGKGCCEKE